jgi:hypothetical protein
MKKILFGTTALLAAGAFAPTAQAADPIKLSVGGYMEYWVAGASQDDDAALNANSFDVQGEGEIHFKGKTTLDNGMTVGVQVELEAGSNHNGDDTIDESYIWVSGKYGKLIAGSENDVVYLTQVQAPEASAMGKGINEGDTNKYLLTNKVVYLDVNDTTNGDANKLSYFTPRMYGLQAGISYAASNNTTGDDKWSGAVNSETVAKATAFDEAWAFALNYKGEFSGVGVAASAGYVVYDVRNDATQGAGHDPNAEDIQAGLQFTYQGFTLGGGAKRRIANAASGLDAGSDGVAWDAGLMYAEGPYAVSLSYTSSNVVGDRAVAEDDEIDLWKLGANYKLGAGVDLFGQLAYLNADKGGDNNAADGNEGAFGGVVGLKLKF